MKKLLPVLLAFCMLFTLPAHAASGKLTATAAESGDHVTVTVRLDNPGIIATRISIRYDSQALELTDAQNGEVFPKNSAMFGKEISANPYTMLWDESLRRDNNTTSGTLCTLTFNVKGGTASGEANVRIVVDKSSTFDVDLNPVVVADGSCIVNVPVVQDSGAATTAKDPGGASTTKNAGTATTTKSSGTASTARSSGAGATTTTVKASAAATSTTKAAQPTAATTKAAATTAKTTAAPEKSTTRKLPDAIASAVSSAASSAAESVKEKTTAGTNAPSTAEQSATAAQNGETNPAASAQNGETAEPVSGETVPELLPVDGTLSSVDEALTEQIIIDPAPPTNHRNLLWLLLLIPAAVVIVLIVRKKKA